MSSAFKTCLWAWVRVCLPASYATINNRPLWSHLLHIPFIIVLSKNNTVSSRDFCPTGGFRHLCGLPFGSSWISSCRFLWGEMDHEFKYNDNAWYLILYSEVLFPYDSKANKVFYNNYISLFEHPNQLNTATLFQPLSFAVRNVLFFFLTQCHEWLW